MRYVQLTFLLNNTLSSGVIVQLQTNDTPYLLLIWFRVLCSKGANCLGSGDLTVCFRLQTRQKVLTKIFCRDHKYCRKIKILPYYPSTIQSGISYLNVIKHSTHLTLNRKIPVKSVPWLATHLTLNQIKPQNSHKICPLT